jgi:hypothetical protein
MDEDGAILTVQGDFFHRKTLSGGMCNGPAVFAILREEASQLLNITEMNCMFQ